MIFNSTIVTGILAISVIPFISSTPIQYERAPEAWETIRGEITAYTSHPGETDDTPDVTASGQKTKDGIVACPSRYPFGTEIEIAGKRYECQDRMNTRYRESSRFDIWVETRDEALTIGLQKNVLIKIKQNTHGENNSN